MLCGLGDAQARRRDPAEDAHAESFLAALHRLVAERGDRIAIVVGADLAHVGPRFGDPRPFGLRQREQLRARDLESVELATNGDPRGFFAHVAEDLDARRVCGLGPLYSALRAMPREARGERLHYDQCVDPEDGSIVSHASLAFFV